MRVPPAAWLWPLLLPALLAVASALLPLVLLWQWTPRGPGDLPRLLLSVVTLTLGALTLVLAPALIALRVLRARAARDGAVRPRLAAFRGLCLGLSGSVVLWAGVLAFGLPSGGRVGLLACSFALPVLGYGVGERVGRKREHR
ncbi:hypothetical protein F8S09_09310 [Deinococcus sp. SDU3-2]|uniref:Uncharacterized protein n=1 Tax=Deinococcus terrestris TaxID=2651870 RepID=A0A7X1NW33_9DEIO|nr:hypothetical protein [Deinococcus terrestris]MPY66885.1 hypothetical protein [Deinococcus terrestris]